MKILRAVLFSIAGLLMAGCLGILVCALNPSLTEMLAGQVEQMQMAGRDGQGEDGSLPDGNGQGTGQEGNGSLEALPGINTGWMTDGNLDSAGDSGLSGFLGLLGLLENGNTYQIPENVPDVPSAELGSLSGYQPVQQENQQIAQEEADSLGSILATGQSGEGLTFDRELYPYYAMLEQDMQQIYRQVYANAMACISSFIPVAVVDVEQLKTVFEAVCNDHPELFWLETGYSCKYLQNGTCVEITLKFNEIADDLETARTNFDAQAARIQAGVQEQGSDLEKERYIHDVLLSYVDYDERAGQNQSAYSALVEGRSVCAGYARAFQYLMQQAGIPCYYCTGFAGQDHAWNIVKLDGAYYNVDVTWDDTSSPTYNFFNKTDGEFAASHIRTGLSVYLPACLGSGSRQEAGDGSQNGGGQSGGGETGSGNGSQDNGSGTGDGGTDNDASADSPAVPDLKPLEWISKNKIDQEGETTQGQPDVSQNNQPDTSQDNLEKAGVTQEEVMDTLDKYYGDCLARLKAAGSGQQQFSNVIPESLWGSVEQAYSSGAYWEGYMESALKELKMEDCAIQLQVQRLGGGYLRVYHSVVTY